MRFVRRVVVANMVRMALNPPAAWSRPRKICPPVSIAKRTFTINRVFFKCYMISYEQVKQAMKNESFIIDVREQSEIVVTGKIPYSTNIPMGKLNTALVLSNEDFQKTYNRKKPDVRHEVIFYCQSGRRAVEAAELALRLGYFRSKAYVGSWEDWEKRSKKQKK